MYPYREYNVPLQKYLEGEIKLIDLHKQETENDYQYIWRICSAKENGILDMSWDDLSILFNSELNRNDTSSAYRKPYQSAKLYRQHVFIDESFEDYEALKREMEIERKKLQTEKLELNRWLREQARDEMICESVKDAIKNLEPLPIPKPLPQKERGTREAVLCFGDAHFGTEFILKGLDGTLLNQYNPSIFIHRMVLMFEQAEAIVRRENLNHLYIFEMGDFIDGVLRVGQLMNLKHGVVESTIKYADFLCRCLEGLSTRVKISFAMTMGNHSELRMLGQPKGSFKDDNMALIVKEYIKTRLADNPNFTFLENSTGYIYEEICGYKVFGFHGDVKNIDKAVNDLQNIYNCKIDYLVCGHVHHSSNKSIGVDKEIITVPSIMGADEYALKLGKINSAGATLFLLEEDMGKPLQYNIILP